MKYYVVIIIPSFTLKLKPMEEHFATICSRRYEIKGMLTLSFNEKDLFILLQFQ